MKLHIFSKKKITASRPHFFSFGWVRLSVVGLARIYLLCSSAAAVEERSSSRPVLKIREQKRSCQCSSSSLSPRARSSQSWNNEKITAYIRRTMRLAALASHWHFESSRAEKFVNIASPAKVAGLRVRLLCNARNCILAGMFFCWIIYYIECCWLEKSLNVEDHYGLIKSEIFCIASRQWWKEHHEVVLRTLLFFWDGAEKLLTYASHSVRMAQMKSRICK